MKHRTRCMTTPPAQPPNYTWFVRKSRQIRDAAVAMRGSKL
jgi:hypothetical protein